MSDKDEIVGLLNRLFGDDNETHAMPSISELAKLIESQKISLLLDMQKKKVSNIRKKMLWLKNGAMALEANLYACTGRVVDDGADIDATLDCLKEGLDSCLEAMRSFLKHCQKKED